MQLRLVSDFLDYYDHWFDLNGPIFKRMSRNNINRKQMLDCISQAGFTAIPFGLVYQMVETHGHDAPLVVYTDVLAHRGENKLLMPAKEAKEVYPLHFCSLYVPSNSYSLRWIVAGDYQCWLKYKSNDAWRSNCGNVDISILDIRRVPDHTLHFPLYAIDFVQDASGKMYGVDFNTSPQLRNTGIEKHIPAKELAESIKKRWWAVQKSNGIG